MVGMLVMAAVVLGMRPESEQTADLGPWSGGVNITTDSSQLPANQLQAASNFIWHDNQLEARQGFYQYVEPLSGNSTKWMQIFRNTTGQKYLFYSDGKKLWCRRNLTDTSVAINYGRVSRGCANTTAGSKIVDIDTVGEAKVRSLIGTGEEWTITVGDTNRIIDFVLDDTLIYVTVAFSTTMTCEAYNIDLQAIEVRQALPVSNNLWFYTNTGKFYFNKPDSVVITDPLTAERWQMTTPYVARSCWNSNNPTLRFTASSFTGSNYAGKFLRLTTDPKSCVAHNPIPAGHAFYMPYPIQTSASGLIYTRGAAFMPDSVGAGAAEYFTIEDLKYDSTTLEFITVDSIQRCLQDSTEWSTCNGAEATYLKIWLRSMPDTMAYGTGDWFVSPSVTTTTMGGGTRSGATYATIVNVIRGSRFTTPDKPAVKVSSMTFKFYGLNNTANQVKGAIYTAGRTLVDTTTTALASLAASAVELTFADPVDLLGNTQYCFVVWCNSSGIGLDLLKNAQSGYGFWSQNRTYSGTFPTTFVPNDSTPYQACVDVAVNYFDSTATTNRDALTCYPVAGGYVTADSCIYVASDAAGFHDHDTCRIAMFRMKKDVSKLTVGIGWATVHNKTVFERRDETPDHLYYSEPNMPDSFLSSHVMVIESGNPIVCGGEQGSDEIIYTATSRYGVTYAGSGVYQHQYLDGFRGCVAQKSFINIDGVHYGLSADGYWETSGEAPTLISQPVASYFLDSLDWNQLDKIATGYDAENDMIAISFPTKGSAVNNVTLYYHRGTGSWWPQTFHAGSYAYNGDVTISDSVRFLAGGADSSRVLVRGGRTDAGTRFAANLKTAYLDFGVPLNSKRLLEYTFGYSAPDTSTGTLTGRCLRVVNGSLASSSTMAVPFAISSGWNRKNLRLPAGYFSGQAIRLDAEFSNASGLKVPTIKVKVIVGGER